MNATQTTMKKTVGNLLYYLWRQGVILRLGDNGEILVSPRSAIDGTLAAAIFTHKPVIVEALHMAGPSAHIDLPMLQEAKRRVAGRRAAWSR